jgi:hypothetical protein
MSWIRYSNSLRDKEAQWLESDFVCGRDGKRILARWQQQGRVRVDLNWLQEWYRTLDQLLVRKERIEVELFGRLRDLFHLQALFGAALLPVGFYQADVFELDPLGTFGSDRA